MELSDARVAVIEDDGEYIAALYERLHVGTFLPCVSVDEAFDVLRTQGKLESVDVLIVDLMLQPSKTLGAGSSTIDAGLSFHKLLEKDVGRLIPVVFHTGATDLNPDLARRVQDYVAASPSTRA